MGTPVADGPTVVVSVDGSAASLAAVRWAAAHVGAVGGTLRAVTAWTWPDASGWGALGDVDWAEDARRRQDAALVDALGDAAAAVGRTVVEGRPARVLLEQARDADLLVVGSRGHGAFTGMLLGSVSLHVVAHAHCPVVVVRAPADHAASTADAALDTADA